MRGWRSHIAMGIDERIANSRRRHPCCEAIRVEKLLRDRQSTLSTKAGWLKITWFGLVQARCLADDHFRKPWVTSCDVATLSNQQALD